MVPLLQKFGIRFELVDERLLHHVDEAFDALGELVRVEVAELHDPARGPAGEVPGLADRQPAGQLAAPGAAHAVGDRHAVRLVGRQRELLGRHVGEQQLLRARPPQDDVVVLVVGPLQAGVARGAEFVGQLFRPLDEVLRGRQGGRDVLDGFAVVFSHE